MAITRKPLLSAKVNAGKLIKELGDIRQALPDTVRRANEATAADVAARARILAMSLGSVHAHVASGIVPQGPIVGLDVGAQPAIMGAEFGGRGRPRTMQFPPWRGAGPGAGYMLFPTLRHEDTMNRYREILDELLD